MTRLPHAVSSRSARFPACRVLRALLRRLDRFAAFTPAARPWRRSAFRKHFTRALMILIALVMLGIAGTENARAQQPQAGGVGVFYAPGGGVGVAKFEEVVSPPCGDEPPAGSNNYNDWQDCIQDARDEIGWGIITAITVPGKQARRALRLSPQANTPFTPTLSSSVAALPFLGNQLVGLSFVPNDPTFANVTAAYSVALRRQSDCSLDEDFLLPLAATPQAAYFTSLTGAQTYYHALAGLTTTANVFANGCTDQTLGLPASMNVRLLGSTSDGAAISAELANNGLYVSVTDLTANTFKTTQVTSGSNPGAFYAADLRGIGKIDLVETGLTDPVTTLPATAVLLSNGDGTFAAPVYYDVSANSGATAAGFTVDDVNGDGKPDIVVLNGTIGVYNGTVIPVTGTVTTLIGKGDGTFTIGKTSNLTWTDSLQAVTGDFNGDGKKDLLVGGTVLLGAGDGSFTQGQTNTALATANFYTAAAGGNAVGSLRNNGKLDVVVSVPGFVSIFYGNGDGTFQTGPSYAGLPDIMQTAITDIDGDGNPDILLGTSTGGIYTSGGYDIHPPQYQILLGRGDGTFVDSVAYPVGTYGLSSAATNTGQEIASADFNGDGKADVLVFNLSTNGNVASALVMLPGDGKGNLGAAVTSTVNNSPAFLVAAKMNHDTLADAVVAGYGYNNSGSEVSVLTNQGNGSFAAEKDYSLAAIPVSLAVGDFNGDGVPDVAVGEAGMGVFVLFGQANGTLGAPVQVDTSANPTGLAAGSLTTDGRTDLVVADQATGTLHVYLGNANGTFTAKTAPTTGATNLSVAALGDLNNDGKLDLIVAGFIPGSGSNLNVANVYTLLGNGDGTFQAANTLALTGIDSPGATSIALADFNNDGKLDVVAGNPSDFSEMLMGKGDGTLIDVMPALGQRPATVAAADLNGDGFAEFFVGLANTQNQGSVLEVFLNQATWTAAATTTTPTVLVTPATSSITTAQSTQVTVAVSGGTGNPTPTGSVTLSGGGYTPAATTLTGGSTIITVPAGALALGTDTLTATYTPDSASSSVYSGATGSNSVTVTPPPSFGLGNSGNINMAAGATTGNTSTITATPSNGFTGTVNLTCALTLAPPAATSPATCGVTPSVNITGATAPTATLTVTTTSTTTPGAYAVTVTGISGSITQMTTVNVTVTAYVPPPSFGLGSTSTTVSVSRGVNGANGIVVTPSGGFTGSVALSAAVTSSPAGAANPPTFSFGATSPVSITGASAQMATLTIFTTPATTGALVRPGIRGVPWYAAGGTALACLLLFGIPARRRRWRAMLFMVILLALLSSGLASCNSPSGGGGAGNPGTTTGSYTVTVTGTSGSTMQMTSFTLNVN